MKWHLEKRLLSDLKEWEINPRDLTTKGIADLRKSIEKFGCAEPLVINTDNTICGGHGRKKVLTMMGIKEVDCYLPDRELTAKEFKELNIRLNKNIAGTFNMDILSSNFEVEDLKEWGFEDKDMGIFDNGYGTDFSLKNGDKLPFQQITFTLADEQVKFINQKIEDVKKTEPFKYCETFGNENSNGNALYFLIRDMK